MTIQLEMKLLKVLFLALVFECGRSEEYANEVHIFINEMRIEMANVQLQIGRLNQENYKLKQSVSRLEDANQALTNIGKTNLERIQALKDENIFLRQNLFDIQQKIEKLLPDDRKLHRKESLVGVNNIDKLYTSPNGTKDKIRGANTIIIDDNSLSNNGGFRLRSLPVQRLEIDTVADNVAFHASINNNVALHDGEIIRFDNVVTNLFHSYDGNTGIFMALTRGYYFFHVNLLTLPNKGLEAHLMKDGTRIIQIYARSADSNYGHGSNVALVFLNTFEKVWVKAHEGYTDTGPVLDGGWCTFTGFLYAAIK